MPEQALVPTHAGIHIAALVPHARARIKSWLVDGSTLTVAGIQLPTTIGNTASEAYRVLCLAPGDWLVMSTTRPPAELLAEITNDLPDGFTAIDLSDALATIRIEGPTARELLSKGCGLDFHPSKFPAGQCARTRFAQIPVVIDCVNPAPRFELHVARSYFAYLHSWLLDAAIEFESITAIA